MASNFFPILSSSPPPSDDGDCLDNDDDDDFGTFASAGDVLGCSSLDSPVASIGIKSPTTDFVNRCSKNGISDINSQNSLNAVCNSFVNDDFSDFSTCVVSNEPNEVKGNQLHQTENHLSSTDDSSHQDERGPSSLENIISVNIKSANKCRNSSNNSSEAGSFFKNIQMVSVQFDKLAAFGEDTNSLEEDELEFCKRSPMMKQLSPRTEQQDNTSQESVPDSGLCNSSQHSETSPLPFSESVFLNTSPEKELPHKIESISDTNVPICSKDTNYKASSQPCIEVLKDDEASYSVTSSEGLVFTTMSQTSDSNMTVMISQEFHRSDKELGSFVKHHEKKNSSVGENCTESIVFSRQQSGTDATVDSVHTLSPSDISSTSNNISDPSHFITACSSPSSSVVSAKDTSFCDDGDISPLKDLGEHKYLESCNESNSTENETPLQNYRLCLSAKETVSSESNEKYSSVAVKALFASAAPDLFARHEISKTQEECVENQVPELEDSCGGDEFDDFQQADDICAMKHKSNFETHYHQSIVFSNADTKFSNAEKVIDSYKHTIRPTDSYSGEHPLTLDETYESGEDNFGDFESVQTTANIVLAEDKSSNFDNAEIKPSSSVSDDFADFETATFDASAPWVPIKASSSSLEENFADFDGACGTGPAMEQNYQEQSTLSTKQRLEREVSKVSQVINAIFPLPQEAAEMEPITLDVRDYDILDRNSKSRRLWDKLQDIDQTPGLRFQWGVSHSFQQLLRSVNIDYHSILRTSSVPFFASALSLLEPTKGPVATTKLEMEDKNCQSPKDPIPPVHFDWGSSGLVNPLDSGQATSTLMDLSFLSSTEDVTSNSAASRDFSLEDELLRSSPEVVSPEFSNKPPILEQLLSLSATSSLPGSRQSLRPPKLSQEATRVLDQLPDISFMRAKVLMFPISSNT